MKENIKISFKFAIETTKQLITLCTGIIALEFTFLNIIVENYKLTDTYLIFLSWFSFLLSIIFGVWTLMALTGSLAIDKGINKISINQTNIRIPSIIQILLFLLGLSLTIFYGIKSFK